MKNYASGIIGMAMASLSFLACAADVEPAPPVVDAPTVKVAAEDCTTKKIWRRCGDYCNGVYGSYCDFGLVCDPDKHKCEKTSPLVGGSSGDGDPAPVPPNEL